MKVEKVVCPACGSAITDEGFQICPYCGQSLHVDDESQKIIYKKVDEARLKEAETKEKIRMKELEMEENARAHKRRKDDRAEKIKTFKTKAIVIGLIILVLALIIFIEYLVLKSKANKDVLLAYQKARDENAAQMEMLMVNQEVSVDALTLAKLVEPASELVSYKYYYTAAGVYEDSKKFFGTSVKVPFTTDKAIYMVDGVISAGIDIGEVKFDVNDDNKTIDVSLPSPKILSHEVDSNSFQYYDVKNSALNSSNLGDYAGMETALKEEQERKLTENTEFWDKTRANVQTTIASLINASGKIDDYRVTYSWN